MCVEGWFLKPVVICKGIFLNFDDVSLGEGENNAPTRLFIEHILCVLLVFSTYGLSTLLRHTL